MPWPLLISSICYESLVACFSGYCLVCLTLEWPLTRGEPIKVGLLLSINSFEIQNLKCGHKKSTKFIRKLNQLILFYCEESLSV